MSPEPKRTFHASEAVHLSDLLNLRFSAKRYGTQRPRYVRVTEPDGPSTDGGRKARQAIMLCVQGDAEDRGLVCGHVSVRAKQAELRSYAYIKSQYEARYKQDIDISRNEYNRLVEELQQYLQGQEYTATVLNTPRGGSLATPLAGQSQAMPRARRSNSGIYLALLLSYGFGFVTCYLLSRYGLL